MAAPVGGADGASSSMPPGAAGEPGAAVAASSDGRAAPEPDLAPADLKIIICGDSAVGKSKLVERFLLDDYSPRTLSTYALTLFRHNAHENGQDYTIDFWDT